MVLTSHLSTEYTWLNNLVRFGIPVPFAFFAIRQEGLTNLTIPLINRVNVFLLLSDLVKM